MRGFVKKNGSRECQTLKNSMMGAAVIPQEKYYSENRGADQRKNNGGDRKHWVVSEMWDLHHEIARRIVIGQKNVEIAKALKITPVTVSSVRNSPIVQEHVSIMRGVRDAETIDLAKEIKEIAPEALILLKDIIRGDNDGAVASINLRARTSEGMLARIGHGIPHRIQSESVNLHLTSQDIAAIKNRAMLSGNVIDVESQEVKE